MMMMIMVKVVIVMILMMMLRRQMGMITIMIMIMMTLIMLIINNKKWTFIGNNALREFSRIKVTTDHIALDRVCDDIDEGRNQSRS